MEFFTDEYKTWAYVEEFKVISQDCVGNFVRKHELPVYRDDTWKSIRERAYEVLCDNLEKWKAWRLEKDMGRMKNE